jgi:hypothetical protein
VTCPTEYLPLWFMYNCFTRGATLAQDQDGTVLSDSILAGAYVIG